MWELPLSASETKWSNHISHFVTMLIAHGSTRRTYAIKLLNLSPCGDLGDQSLPVPPSLTHSFGAQRPLAACEPPKGLHWSAFVDGSLPPKISLGLVYRQGRSLLRCPPRSSVRCSQCSRNRNSQGDVSDPVCGPPTLRLGSGIPSHFYPQTCGSHEFKNPWWGVMAQCR